LFQHCRKFDLTNFLYFPNICGYTFFVFQASLLITGNYRVFNRSRLHIGDIARDASEDELRQLFEQAGPVETIQMPTQPDGAHKGFAFIEMKDSEGARRAIQMFNGYDFKGRPLFVFSVPPRSQRKGETND
jgi:RNA recognition motif-containing protein